MARLKTALRTLRGMPVARFLRIPRRSWHAAGYFLPSLRNLITWSLVSKEDSNYTYDLTPQSLDYVAHTIGIATRNTPAQVREFMDEARSDAELAQRVVETTTRSPSMRQFSDAQCRFGRRLGWYAIARVMKPRVIVETGVDKGLGAVLLCCALRRNAQEGHPGRYFGTDIDLEAGELLVAPYDEFGEILYGDSIESLRFLEGPVDVFINDSDHSAEYEAREYETIAPKLASHAILVGDNAHATDKLMRFSDRTGRRFLLIRESPDRHWYPGGGIGLSFSDRPRESP